MITAAILLAAERPPDSDIAAALWAWGDGVTLIEYQVASLRAAGVDVIDVVLGYDAEAVLPLVGGDRVEAVAHDRWQSPAASLRAGATAVPRETVAAIITDVRQPRPAAVYGELLARHLSSGAEATRPTYREVAGAPVVVNAAILAEARNAQDDSEPLGAVLRRHTAAVWSIPFDTDAVLIEIAAAGDCARARRLFDVS
ncbi:MAG TPA: NTP transferase domain-containing protein [Dehalococcoidia bacterium]|nr:NTP transferase domain-containing protein [Dehalococcoidia bacterium]